MPVPTMNAATISAPTPSTWETFAITDTRWLLAAFGWSFAMLSALAYVRWLFSGFHLVLGLSLLAAVATAYASRTAIGALPVPTVVRFAFVDAVFVAFTLHPLFTLFQFALAFAGIAPGTSSPLYGFVPTAIFVLGFYASLGAIGHLQSKSSSLRFAPLIAAVVVAAMLVPGGYVRYTQYAADQGARDAGVASYEKATGKQVRGTDKLAIGNSLHGFDHRVGALAIDREGRLLVSGGFNYYAGQDARGIVRLLPDGRLDTTFAAMPPGDPVTFAPSLLLVAADGSIIVNSVFPGAAAGATRLTRLAPDGTLDARFQPAIGQDTFQRQPLEAIDLLPDGSLVLASPPRFINRPDDACVQRIGPDGAHDAAFEAAAMAAIFGPPEARGRNVNCSVSAITVLASGQVLLQGAFPATNHRHGLLRLNGDGTLDAGYRPELGNTEISRSAVGPSGEFLAAAHELVPGSSPPAYQARFVKLRADGGREAGFNLPAGHFKVVERVAFQPDGKILVTGTIAPSTRGAIFRFMPDGSPDLSFGGPEGGARVDGFVTSLRVQPDGRIVVGGEFLEVTGPRKGEKAPRFNIARLNADGTLDASFDPAK
ncbi:MAG: hypothetical protein AB7I13_20840 [Vicinamibacterales bacterium]